MFVCGVASCPKCNFDSAYFYQLQIRSADEPMTTCALVRCWCGCGFMLIGLCSAMLYGGPPYQSIGGFEFVFFGMGWLKGLG